MNEQDFAPPAVPQAHPSTAGAILRAERERQGLTLEALAATLKVQVSKLEMLEADRIDGLLDRTFARALAQSLCRVLKVEPRRVLDLLPQQDQPAIEPLGQAGLNQPFRDGGRRRVDWGSSPRTLGQPLIALTLLLLAGAAAVVFWPPAAQDAEAPAAPALAQDPAAPDPAASLPLGPGVVAEGLPASAIAAEGAASGSAVPVAAAAAVAPAGGGASGPVAVPPAAAASAPGAGPLALQAVESSWIEVREAGGKVLLSRTLAAGESLRLDGVLPLSLTVGNVKGTQVSFRDTAIDLNPLNRGNVARLELK